METMRDAFFNTLFEYAKKDSRVMVITSDFSAPSFDQYRTCLPNQFINSGISEQNTILVAAGLAMSGMKVYVISISPFITKRCYEQIGLFVADAKLDVTIVGVGAGFSYSEAGATHHSVEDIGLMQMLPHMNIYSASDNYLVKHFVHTAYVNSTPNYIRLDRRSCPEVYTEATKFNKSLMVVKEIQNINILSTGYMLHKALEIQTLLQPQNIDVGIIDAFSLPLAADELVSMLKNTQHLVTIEEHVAAGGLGESVHRELSAHNIDIKLKSFALNLRDGFCHTYGSRDVLHARHGISNDEIIDYIKSTVN